MLFWDFTQAIVVSSLIGRESWKAALKNIECAFGEGDDYVDGVISASFLEPSYAR